MNNRIIACIRAAAICLMLAGFAATAASAQVAGPLTITNNTACKVLVCWNDGTSCAVIAPNSQTTVKNGCTALVYISSCATMVKLGPGHTFLSNVNLGACCADVAFSPGFVACTWFLTIDPAAGPCPC